MSPSSVCERPSSFAAPYERDSPAGAGGGVADEAEDIEVLELALREALALIGDGRSADAKTIVPLRRAERRGVGS